MEQNEYEEILKSAGQMRDYTAANLSELVKARSMSSKEKEAADVLVSQLNGAGIKDVHIDGLGNVIGKLGSGKRIIAFDGHIDTVDTGNLDNWELDPFSGKIEDGHVFGRGAADQKGGVASFVTAAKIVAKEGLNSDITVFFIGSVMEEDCDGLCWKYIIEKDKIVPDLVISTEPTSLNIYRGQRGRMEMDIEFKGVSSHGSAPERGKNAIYMGSKLCSEIEKLNERLKGDDFLGKGTITVTEFVSNSPSLCAVADYAKIHIDRRLTWGENEVSAVKEIKELMNGIEGEISVPEYREKSYTGLEYGMKKYFPTWKISEENIYIKKGEEVFENLFDKKPLTDKWTFSTNGVTINGIYKIPVLGFGPGHEKMAHAPNEKVSISELEKASAFYAAYILSL